MNPSEQDASQSEPANGQLAPGPASESLQVRTCWTQIGVQGDGSCAELQKFTHCRNCPVYANAAVQLLDRPLLPAYRREWSEHFAKPRHLTAPAKTSALLFRIGPDWLALPTQAFQEVAENRLVHSLPHRNQGLVLGLVNIRGELLVCVSLSRLLDLEKPPTRATPRRTYDRLLVTNWDGNRLVFPADEVRGIHRFHLADLRELPGTVAKSDFTYALGLLPWQGKTIGFLDAERLFAALNRSLS